MPLLPVLEGLHSAEAFNPAFLAAFLERVREIEKHPQDLREALRGRVVATVFEEPSTRTRLSFEAAAHRLGAGVITVADPRTSSRVKGETLRDSARIVGGYADLLVWRHPRDGASRLVSQAAGVPVVNGGDGRLGHPTQTLVDLFTLYRDWGGFEGRTVGLMGDLMHGRTARSLAWGLSLLGARVVALPAPGLDWESSFESRILDRADYRAGTVSHPMLRSWTGVEEARVLEPRGLHQGTLFHQGTPEIERLDALYLTRLQDERGAEANRGVYPGLRLEQLEDPLLTDCLFLHPLPRRAELPEPIDDDPRARYFQQARNGPVVRMAVFLAMLRADAWSLPPLTALPAGNPEHELGACPNPDCITHDEGLTPPWRVVGRRQRHFLCAYCDSQLGVEYAGCRSSRRLHPLHSQASLRIRPENLRPFRERDEALRQGYVWWGS
jgi:aspartate carbamoyltransferase catalytic subunit